MGYRLSKIYTRTGDNGTTGMADGRRLEKDHPRMAAIGDIDELNSLIGVLIVSCAELPIRETLVTIQHDLFNVGGQLAMPECELINAPRIQWLEQALDQLNQHLPPLQEFILPGGGEAASRCHVARAVCRRAERSLVSCHREDPLASELLAYVNRLSDFLFVASRYLAREAGEGEVYWQSKRISETDS